MIDSHVCQTRCQSIRFVKGCLREFTFGRMFLSKFFLAVVALLNFGHATAKVRYGVSIDTFVIDLGL